MTFSAISIELIMTTITYTRIILFIFTIFIICTNIAYSNEIDINISSQSKGKLNPLVFGMNLIGYDPSTSEGWGKNFYGYSNYGAGIWSPDKRSPVPEVVNLAKNLKISVLRFPGGDGSWFYNWKNTIGSPSNRRSFLFGLDEFLHTCEAVGAQAIFTLPYYTMTVQDAADLVEYLNGRNDGRNEHGGVDWAKVRSENGHPKPYNVKYFELGNEVFYGVPAKSIPPVNPIKYANDYLAYQAAMKSVDPSVRLGAVTVNSGFSKGLSAWNEELFGVAGKRIDFLVEHTYRPGYGFNKDNVDQNALFAMTLDSLDDLRRYYKDLSAHFAQVTGRKNIPIAVTELNAGFTQDKPAPFRHTLGSALFNAGLLQILSEPENNILMANYWQFINSYWGMLKNDQYMTGRGTYSKRPNYYVYEMFSKHYGTNLLRSEVKTSQDIKNEGHSEKANILENVKWEKKYFSDAKLNTVKNTVSITFNSGKDVNFYHVYKRVNAKPNTVYHLSGYIKADNLRDVEGICLVVQDGRGWREARSSATTRRVWGTSGWVHVATDYFTLPDTSSVEVVVRRVGGKGVVTGSVTVKDVKLTEKLINQTDNAGSLSVTASTNAENNRMYIMVLNKNVYADVAAILNTDAHCKNSITAWTLNGPSLDATNENNASEIMIIDQIISVKSCNKFKYIFPAHSLTSLEVATVSKKASYKIQSDNIGSVYEDSLSQ